MPHKGLLETASRQFEKHFGRPHTAAAYAPGRIEVLGNHTDYNEGFVLSAAIDAGTVFLAAPSAGPSCRVLAGDVLEEAKFDVRKPERDVAMPWANYVKGVVAGLRAKHAFSSGFDGMLLGNIPLGAGLSSSAALETASALALCSLYDLPVDRMELAKIGQQAEHAYAGVKCGLLDQISSLFGRRDSVVMTDFRTLAVETLPLGEDACFLMCNTHVKHRLVESAYNERRTACEQAAASFAAKLDHPVKALRDVSMAELEEHVAGLDPVVARRAAHVIGENERVQVGRKLLAAGDLPAFGQLMFASHESSRTKFENSCKELDVLVDAARGTAGVLGARLSGGGFGGSAVVLAHPRDAGAIGKSLSAAFRKTVGRPCEVRVVTPSDGAAVLKCGT
jgi:galactokinase